MAEGISGEGGERDATIGQCPSNVAKRQHVIEGQQQIACCGQSQRGERLPSLEIPECSAHLAWPVYLCVPMEDNECCGKKEKRRDAADVREEATPVSVSGIIDGPQASSLATRSDRG